MSMFAVSLRGRSLGPSWAQDSVRITVFEHHSVRLAFNIIRLVTKSIGRSENDRTDPKHPKASLKAKCNYNTGKDGPRDFWVLGYATSLALLDHSLLHQIGKLDANRRAPKRNGVSSFGCVFLALQSNGGSC